MRFRTTIEQAGKTAMGFEVPPEVVEGLGAGKRPPVTVMIKGYSYRNTVAVLGGRPDRLVPWSSKPFRRPGHRCRPCVSRVWTRST